MTPTLFRPGPTSPPKSAPPSCSPALLAGVANQDRPRIERSEVIPSGQVSAARQVGGEKQTKQVSETAQRAAMRPEGGDFDPTNLAREGSKRIVLRRDRVEIGNSGFMERRECAVRLNG